MENLHEMISQINVADLIKLFNIQISVAIFLVFLIFRGMFSHIILKIVYTIFKKKGKIKESKIYKILNSYFIFVGLYLSIRMFELSKQALAHLNTCFQIISIIYVTNITNSFITKDARWFRKYVNHSKNDAGNKFICKIIRGIVWVISGYIIMKEIGYDLTDLVALLGIGGVVISLAAQDTVKSLLSGVGILLDKPFDIGDLIEVGTYKGNVIDITFRSTRIKALDNSIITIPNAIITQGYIVNWNKLQSRRFECILNLSMDTSTDKIKDLIEKLKLILKNNSVILPDTVLVNLDEISSYSTDIKVVAYVNETNYAQFLNIKEKIYCDILELVEIENIDLAYPTQTVYVKNNEITEENKE